MNLKQLRLNKYVKGIFYGLLAVICLWALYTIAYRIKAERANNTVELCIDFNQAVDLCQANNYPLADFLARCQAIGAVSVAVREETPNTLALSRKIIFFDESDFSRFNVLDLLSGGSELRPGSILTADKVLTEQTARQFSERYNLTVKQSRIGKYRVFSPDFPSGFRPAFWNKDMPLGFSPEKVDLITKSGMRVVLRPLNAGNPQWLDISNPENVSGFLWDGKEVPGYSGREDVLGAALLKNNIKYVDLEFNYVTGNGKIEKRVPFLAVRGHNIGIQEMNKSFSQGPWLTRWERAVKERGIRFLLVYFWDNRPIEENISYLRTLARNLKNDGYTLGTANPPGYPARPGSTRSLWFLLIFISAITFPVLGLYAARRQGSPFKSFFICNGLTLAGALFISAMLFDVVLMQKLADIPGVKAMMLLPMILAFFIAYPPEEIGKMLAFRIQLKHVMLAFAALVGVVVLLLRSGNYNLLASQPEYFFRDLLEQLFGFRPRTKEFLLGQPLLFLGFFYKKPWLLLIGIIGQVSIINTFLHAHSPVMGSLARSVHGIWLGLLIGWAASLLIEKVRKLRA